MVGRDKLLSWFLARARAAATVTAVWAQGGIHFHSSLNQAKVGEKVYREDSFV